MSVCRCSCCRYVVDHLSARFGTPRGCEGERRQSASREIGRSIALSVGSQMQEVQCPNPRLGGLRVSPLQAPGGISTLQTRASGFQSSMCLPYVCLPSACQTYTMPHMQHVSHVPCVFLAHAICRPCFPCTCSARVACVDVYATCMPCARRVYALCKPRVSPSCAMRMPCVCHARATFMPGSCNVYATCMPCVSHVFATCMPCVSHLCMPRVCHGSSAREK